MPFWSRFFQPLFSAYTRGCCRLSSGRSTATARFNYPGWFLLSRGCVIDLQVDVCACVCVYLCVHRCVCPSASRRESDEKRKLEIGWPITQELSVL